MSKYIYWKQALEIRKSRNNIIQMMVMDNFITDTQEPSMGRSYTVNDTAAEIIHLINGRRTYEEVISLLSAKYCEDHYSIELKVKSLLDHLSNAYRIDVGSQEYPEERPVNIIENESMYPIVATVELTNKCNIKCMHCYGDYGPTASKVMSLDKARNLFKDLEEVGVKILELTGGEITVHPGFKEILLYALSLKFEQIALLTNGIALSREVIDIIIQNKSRIIVQIDLHSLDDNYLTWFAKVPNTLNRIKNSIIKLAEEKVTMRVATVVTSRNINEIIDIADWVHDLGIVSFAISPILKLGRASDSENDLFINLDAYELEEKFNIVKEKYGEKYLSIIEGHSQNKNCGCLSSHVSISPDGNIKICSMDTLEYINSSIGNVFERNIKDLYDENWEYIIAFFNTESAKFDSVECEECENKYFCSDCLLRGFLKANEIKDSCKWYHAKVSKTVKDKLLI